jgi:Na+/proline symporter
MATIKCKHCGRQFSVAEEKLKDALRTAGLFGGMVGGAAGLGVFVAGVAAAPFTGGLSLFLGGVGAAASEAAAAAAFMAAFGGATGGVIFGVCLDLTCPYCDKSQE